MRWWRIGSALSALALVAVALGDGVPRVLAHAVLLRSTPAANARLASPPSSIDLFFSEPLDKKQSTVDVRDTTGAQVDKKDVSFSSDPTEMKDDLTALKPGFYTVEWTTVSAVDGHHLTGTLPFTVLNPDGSTPSGTPPPSATSSSGGSAGFDPVDSIVRFLLLCGLIGVTGGFAFALLVLYPAAATLAWPDSQRARTYALWLLGAAVPAAALLALIMDAATVVRMIEAGGGAGSIADVLNGTAGREAIYRAVLLVLVLLLSWLIARRERRPDGRVVLGMLGAGLLLGLGALLTLSLTSHAAAGLGSDWAVPVDFLHVAGVSVWLGGLVLLPALLRVRHGIDGAQRVRFQGQALRRFSIMALLCVGLVLLSGTFNALVQIPDWSALVHTTYGQTLLVKLALIVPLLAVGGLNALRIARKFEAALNTDDAASVRSQRLARSALVETGFGAAVIAATAVLVFFVPAKDSIAQRNAQNAAKNAPAVSSIYRNTAPASDLQTTLTVSPNRVGQNDFKVQLQGADIDKVTRVELRFQIATGAAGQSTLDLNPVAGTPGLFDGQAANFSFVGDWRVTVNIRRDGHDDANGLFTVEVPDATGATTATQAATSRSASAFPAHGITPQQFWGGVLVAAGLALFLFRRRIWSMNVWAGQAGIFCMVGAVLIGLVVVVTGRPKPASPYANLLDPVPADTRSIADGKALFAQNCAACHGDTAHGDGPAAAALNPKPLDLTVHVGLHPDGVLFDWITNGIERTAMPAWKSKLSDQQRWDIINYLRTLSVTGDAQPAAPNVPALAARPAR